MSAIESPIANASWHPQRTCVGCRGTSAKSQLLRVICIDGVVTADPEARCEGRGAYLHRSPECLTKAESRRAFRRAFRLDANPAVSEALRSTMTTTHHAGA